MHPLSRHKRHFIPARYFNSAPVFRRRGVSINTFASFYQFISRDDSAIPGFPKDKNHVVNAFEIHHSQHQNFKGVT